MKNTYISGSKIYLRPASIEDAKGNWYKWLNDPDITKYLANQFWPNTKSKQINFLKQALKSKERVVFSICLKKNNMHIGQCSLSSINWVHRFTDIALIIGEKKYKNGIYAIEVFKLLLQIAFERFNLENVKSYSANPISTKIHQLLGFKFAGCIKDLMIVDRKRIPLNIFYISKKMWQSLS